MKKQSVNTIAKRLFAGSLAAAFFFLATPYTSNATVGGKIQVTNVADKNNNGVVEYLGNTEENFFFRVKLNNPNAEFVSILILDESGETISRITSKDKQINKVFQLSKESGLSKLTFIVKGSQINVEQSYNVDIVSKVIQDVVVSKN
ncbi:MAG: hypothetical protein C0459_05365 [Chitinophaga sp.]|jgi:hypothetical protein|nr:hypothetical protein [Chitinophaga sp.]